MAAAASAMGVKVRPQCFFDIEINREPVGRITFQLFSDVCQKTCNNFLYLCTGEKGIGKSTGKKLCYKGSTFHRVVKNFMIQGGDFTEGNGKGGESIYGGYFKDENFILKHDRAFLLSMANRGKHTNGSQFFITTRAAPHLDNVHVVFGLVISGFEVIETIENLKTDAASRPYADVRVIDCGLIQTQPSNEERIPKLTLDPEAFVSENVMKVLSVPPVSENITNTLPIPETSVSKRILKVTPALETPIAKKMAKPAHTPVPSNAKKIIKVPPVPEISVSENIPKVLNVVEASAPRIVPKDHSGSDQSDSSSKSTTSSETSFSESELEVEKGRKKKRKRKTKLKAKHAPKRRKDERRKEESRREDRRKDEPRKGEKGKEDRNQKRSANHRRHADKNGLPEDLSKDLNLKREKLVVRPEEIPPVPENKFLLRRDVPVPAAEPEPKPVVSTPGDSDQKPSISKSGRKIKGRGTMRYHTPPRSRSCSESEDDDQSSETPPHWKEEMQRVRAYKPTSGVKWSKGDKLKEGHGRDERNRSQRSRSWSHDGFYSDLSKDRYGNVDNNRKERKAKHKKKSKKQKQPRNTKPLKTEVPFVTEIVASHSSLKQRKYFRDQEKRSSSLSSSLSSKHSSKREWCKSDKEQSFSSSSARKSRSHSKSRSRSYSREHSRSRTASKSTSRSRNRSRSQSRSRSRSRTRSRSRSRTRSRSHSRTRSRSRISTRSRSKSRSNSKSRRHVSVSRSPRKNSTQPIENKTKQKETPRLVVQQNDKPPVLPAPESIPLIPLSDSPPPSRWKPGLKPWKPSYERIQEIKTKPSNVEPLKSSSAVSLAKQKYLNSKTQVSSDSEQSDRSTHYTRKSKSRSTSRSYTRSFSRSRSRSSSRSISPSSATSQSQHKYLSANSSYYKSSSSNSDEDERRNVQRKNTLVPKTKENSSESLLNRQTTIDSKEACDPCQEVEKSVAKIESPEGKESKNILQKTVLDLSEKPIKEEESSLEKHSNDEYINRQSELDSTCISEKKEITNVNDDPVQSSGKEEGEASSDSEVETINFKSDTKTRSESPKIQPPLISDVNSKNRESSSDSNVANLVLENHREKSKKHKHRSSKKNNKKAHLKKSKEKSKLKKEQKHKLQKRKPAFLWQPPLEYGEEDDEEVDEGVIVKPLPKTGKNDKLFQSETHKSEDKSKKGKKAKSVPVSNLKSEEKLDHTSSSNISNPATLAKPPVACETSKHSKVVTDNDCKSDDNMDICTPDHTSSDNDTEDLACIIDTKAAAVITGNGKLLTDGSAKTDPLNQAKSGKEAENVKVNITGGKSNTLLPLVLSVNSHKQPEKDANAQSLLDNKWKPVQGPSNMKAFIPPSKTVPVVLNAPVEPESKPQGVRIEIKSKNRVKPGSLFDEVRKTARLNRRPRNQESSSEESSEDKSPSRSRSRSRSKSRSRTRSHSYSHSRSRSRSSSSSSRSRSYSRSRSRRRHSRKRRRGHSSSSDRYRNQSRHYTRSRSRSRSRSYSRHRRSSRSRSYTYDSYSRSRSRSKRSYSRSRSYDRRSRSRRSYRSSRSDRSYSYSGSSTDG